MEKLKKEDLINIINNLNLKEIKTKMIRLAFNSLNEKKQDYTIIALLSIIDGKIEYKIEDAENPTDVIIIARYDVKPFYLDYEPEDILDGDALNEFLSVIEDEDSEFFEEKEYALEYILDNYELDKDKLVLEYFINSNLDNVKMSELDEITNKL